MLIPDCGSSGSVQIGCVPDGAGGSLGPVFLDPETTELWFFEFASASVVRPYAGPVGACAAGGSQISTDVEVVCSDKGRYLAINLVTFVVSELDGSPVLDGAVPSPCPATDREIVTVCVTDGVFTYSRADVVDGSTGSPVLVATLWFTDVGGLIPPPAGPFTPCAELTQPIVRWDCACDSGAVNTVVWQKFSSTDNGLTWTLLGVYTEEYGTTPATIIGPIVDCATVGVGATGHRARRAVFSAGSNTVIPSGLPSVGLLIESLSWSSRNATGTITDSAGTVSSFVAGEGDTWDMEWDSPATLTIAVTTGDVVVSWVELV